MNNNSVEKYFFKKAEILMCLICKLIRTFMNSNYDILLERYQ